MNSATLPLLAIAARLAAERRINAKDRPPHSTQKIARVGAYPDRPHLRCVTRKPVGPQYGITLLAAGAGLATPAVQRDHGVASESARRSRTP